MRLTIAGLGVAVLAATGFLRVQQPPRAPGGVALSDLTWMGAQSVLTESSVVVIPLGAGAIEHGPHMKLNSDERLARYLASRVQAAASVVIAPPLTYHFYPAFIDYPGSTTLTETAARDTTVEIVRSLGRSGPRRFYVLNTAVAPLGPLSKAAQVLADEGVLLGYTDPDYHLRGAVQLKQTPIKVAHADEVATSMMLYVDPSAVDMSKAVREYGPGIGALTRKKDTPGVYSESGVLGDATVATREKGQALVEALVAGVLDDIENVRRAPLPPAKTAAPPASSAPRPAPRPTGRSGDGQQPNGCMPGDERTIRGFGPRFTYWWTQMDAKELTALFTSFADMRHPDATIERGRPILLANRLDLFKLPEYQGSTHHLTLNDIRCLGADVAIADGKWDLRMTEPATKGAPARVMNPGRLNAGLCTLVFVKSDGGWLIEAWRYTVDPPNGAPPPSTLKQPGFIGRGGH